MTIVQWLLLPAFVHVAWVYLIAFRMGAAKQRDVREGLVSIKDVALDNSRWPVFAMSGVFLQMPLPSWRRRSMGRAR